jgi:hypothetical protein
MAASVFSVVYFASRVFMKLEIRIRKFYNQTHNISLTA